MENLPMYVVCNSLGTTLAKASTLANWLSVPVINQKAFSTVGTSADPIICVNYGKGISEAKYPYCDGHTIFQINNLEAINNSQSAEVVSDTMSNAGVGSLKYYADSAHADYYLSHGQALYITVPATKYTKKKVVVVKSMDEYEKYSKHSFTVEVDSSMEIRVHVAFGKILVVHRKRPMSKEKLKEIGIVTYDKKLRSSSNGWEYCKSTVLSTLSNSARVYIENAAKKAIEALSLSFGSVDMLVSTDPDDDELLGAWVLGVNTSPKIQVSPALSLYKKEILLYQKECSAVVSSGILEIPGIGLLL